MKISGILITMLSPFENHMANCGEKLFGNANSIKRRPDGRAYLSGQMQKHVLFSAIDRLNSLDPAASGTFVSNGDGVTNLIEQDLRADMGGFMHTNKGDYSGRRIAPISATPAVAIEESAVGRDLLVRIKFDPNDDSKDQALATREFSQFDMMNMNFFLDVSSLGTTKVFEYKEGFNLGVKYFKHVPEVERIRRVKLFIEATRLMNDYANQARNAVCGEPEKVLIVFSERLSRKASRYFTCKSTKEQQNILRELEESNDVYFLGDDTGDKSVFQAYQEALAFLVQEKNSLVDLATPVGAKEDVKGFLEVFPEADKKTKSTKTSKKGSSKNEKSSNSSSQVDNSIPFEE